MHILILFRFDVDSMIYYVSVYTFVYVYFCILALIFIILLGCFIGVINDYDDDDLIQ